MARLLDLPIERFLDEGVAARHVDVMELLKLWDGLMTVQDRTAALNFMRWMAVDSGY